MSTDIHNIIKLAALEINIGVDNIDKHCEPMCKKLYEYAGEDGHAVMNSSSLNCTCVLNTDTKPTTTQQPQRTT